MHPCRLIKEKTAPQNAGSTEPNLVRYHPRMHLCRLVTVPRGGVPLTINIQHQPFYCMGRRFGTKPSSPLLDVPASWGYHNLRFYMDFEQPRRQGWTKCVGIPRRQFSFSRVDCYYWLCSTDINSNIKVYLYI